MDASSNGSSHGTASGGTAFALGADSVASSSVASLDPPLVQQTKSEIRNLAAEIAHLAHSPLTPDEFFSGFLPRLCAAMGATGAVAWQLSTETESEPQRSITQLAGHSVPAQLYRDTSVTSGKDSSTRSCTTEPTDAHREILNAIIAEGQPILVPPGDVKIEKDRPNNPIRETLIVVPVRIHDHVEFVLEVIQRPSGGPSAQRGYLRFVAQMADLMSDYLRRQQLRNVSEERHQLRRTEHYLLAIASVPQTSVRRLLAADALSELLDAEHAILVRTSPTMKAVAVSDCNNFDPRSETVLAAEALVQKMTNRSATPVQLDSTSLGWESFQASERRNIDGHEQESATDEPADIVQQHVDELCQLLGCRWLVIFPLGTDAHLTAIVAFTMTPPDSLSEKRFTALACTIGNLLSATRKRGWLEHLAFTVLGIGQIEGRRKRIERVVTRLAIVGIGVMIAMFPVSQHVAATATLHPTSKRPYYAPHAGVVTQVLVEDGQTVKVGDILLKLTNPQLESRLDELVGELQLTEERIAEKTNRLSRGSELPAQQYDEIEGEIEQLKISQRALGKQATILQQQLNELVVVAAEDGTLASWDIRNSLQNRPVQAGDLLATTFVPDQAWSLLIAVPDLRAGMVSEAMSASDNSARVQFALSSHPDEIQSAAFRRMASQATLEHPNSATNQARRVVLVEAVVAADDLPIRKDGAVARATIDCGKVPAIWLVSRDAIRAISSRIQMLW